MFLSPYTVVTMKFSVLGATGESGKYLLEQALADGHQVIALVRNPDKITTTHDNLEVSLRSG